MRVIRYTAKPEKADENERLIRAVFAELKATAPKDVRYAALRLPDGAFVHIVDMPGGSEALTGRPSFQAFQREVKDRMTAPPLVGEAVILGNHGIFDE